MFYYSNSVAYLTKESLLFTQFIEYLNLQKMRLFLLSVLFCYASSLFSQVSLSLETFASGFSQPIDVVHAGDARLFVVEKGGRIKIVDAGGNTTATPFLDIDARVNSIASERGLLGLAFHPDYAENGYFYVNYTDNSGDTRVSRFTVTADPNIADPDSEVILMELNQPYSNHNGGCLRFGPDGYLYIGTGDGGAGGDPENSGQDRQSLLGKMLRIDVDNGNPYAVPEDNPFAMDDFTLDEIWALGLRNPWRYSFDSETGDLWIADVGQNDWEEIDFQPADSEGGENYGWRCYEGNEPYNTQNCDDFSAYYPPVHVYENSNSIGCSVTGGVVYRGSDYPEAYGWYIYADFCSGRIWALYPNKAGEWVNIELLNTTNSEIVSFGEDTNREMYMVGIGSGTISRVTFECNTPAAPGLSGDVALCGPQSTATLTSTGAPEGYEYCWFRDGELIEGASGNTLTVESPGSYTTTLVAGSSSCTSTVSEPALVELINMPEVLIFTSESELQATEGFVAYQWELNGQAIDGATASTYVPDAPGNYWVIVTDEFGCQWQSITVTIVSALNELEIEDFVVAPNPFEDFLRASFRVVEAGRYTLRLVNAAGQEHWKMEYDIQNEWNADIPVSSLPAGNYFLEVSRAEKKLTVPLVKQ